jgi:hypothetical protein
MNSDEDVIMTDEQVPTSTTNPRRTDHDWQVFFVPTTRIKKGIPPLASQNLISLYGLGKIEARVRRADLETGEKILKNKIRKSYEGKVKDLHISGVNKAVSVPRELIGGDGLLAIPEETWKSTKVAGNDVLLGPMPSFLAKLDRAVAMAPGKLPDRESDKWKKLIGQDQIAKVKPADAMRKSNGVANGPPTGPPSAAPSPGLRPTTARPARKSAKRSYHDSTFTGYGEGFADEDGSIISEEESRSRGIPMNKKRRTDRKVGNNRSSR